MTWVITQVLKRTVVDSVEERAACFQSYSKNLEAWDICYGLANWLQASAQSSIVVVRVVRDKFSVFVFHLARRCVPQTDAV